jgi:Ca-activated chloride channel family protein
MMRRLTTVITVLAVLILSAPVLADSAGKLVRRGNDSFDRGDLDAAAEYYDLASVKIPESPIVEFNLGNVEYMRGDFAAARSRFEEAALKSRDLTLEAKALYNIGNCAFRQGQRQADSDLEKALEFFKESVEYYSAALEKEPGMPDAAHNLEVARLLIKDLLDAIKKQQEQQQEQQEKLREVVDSLLAVMKDQNTALGRSLELEDSKDRGTPDWNGKVDGIKGDQTLIAGATGEVSGMLTDLFKDQQPEQVQQALAHLDSSIVDQEGAINDLGGRKPGEAADDQQDSLEQMRKALEKLTEGEGENKDQQQQQDPQDQEEQQQQQQDQEPQQPPEDQQKQQEQQKRSETAKDILDEEKKNREKRKQAASGYRKVDKDW